MLMIFVKTLLNCCGNAGIALWFVMINVLFLGSFAQRSFSHPGNESPSVTSKGVSERLLGKDANKITPLHPSVEEVLSLCSGEMISFNLLNFYK